MSDERKQSYFRQAILGPVGIPIAVLIGVAFVIVNVSRVFLTVSKNGAVLVGVIVSVIIMAGCTMAATRRRIRNRSLVVLLALFAILVGAAGGVAADRGERKFEKHGSSEHNEPVVKGSPGASAATGPTIEIVAKALVFDKKTLEAKAKEEITIRLKNEDTFQHNWSLYEDEAMSKSIYDGSVFADGGATHDYSFEAPAAGTYYFKCDIHPTMRGTFTAA